MDLKQRTQFYLNTEADNVNAAVMRLSTPDLGFYIFITASLFYSLCRKHYKCKLQKTYTRKMSLNLFYMVELHTRFHLTKGFPVLPKV